jgi:hypothetical protein
MKTELHTERAQLPSCMDLTVGGRAAEMVRNLRPNSGSFGITSKPNSNLLLHSSQIYFTKQNSSDAFT